MTDNHPDAIRFVPVLQRTGGAYIECNNRGGDTGYGVFSLDNLYMVITNTYEPLARLVVLSRDGYETHEDVHTRLGEHHTEIISGRSSRAPVQIGSHSPER